MTHSQYRYTLRELGKAHSPKGVASELVSLSRGHLLIAHIKNPHRSEALTCFDNERGENTSNTLVP